MGIGMTEKLMAESESGFIRLRRVFLGSGRVVSGEARDKFGATNIQPNDATNRKNGRRRGNMNLLMVVFIGTG